MKKITIVFFVFVFVLAACGGTATEAPVVEEATPAPANAVIAEGHIVPAKDATLAFQARGTVTEVNVKIGDKVTEGTVLARIGASYDGAYQAALAEHQNAQQAHDDFIRNLPLYAAQAWQNYMEAQVKRAAAERRWEGLNLDNIQTRLDDAIEEAENRKEDLEEAQAEFDKYKDELEENYLRQNAESNLESAQEDYNEALRKIESIRRERDSVRAMLDAALAAEAEAKYIFENEVQGPQRETLTLIDRRLVASRAALAAYYIVAPFDGTVMDVNASVGEQVGPETWAVKIADTSAWYVETNDLTELEVVKIAVGLKASILPDALSDAKMTGVVESISQAFTLSGGDVQYRVKILVDEIDPRVLWGMTVEITFEPLP